MAKTQIKNYVFKPGIGANDNLFPNAYSLLNSNKAYIQKEAGAYITAKIAAAAQYTPTGRYIRTRYWGISANDRHT